jgi:ribosome-associated protein
MSDWPDEEREAPSRSELKRQSRELQDLGEELVQLPAAELAAIELPEDLREAVETARRITAHGARVRQTSSPSARHSSGAPTWTASACAAST